MAVVGCQLLVVAARGALTGPLCRIELTTQEGPTNETIQGYTEFWRL